MFRSCLLGLFLISFTHHLSSQIEGDDLFGTDQIISIELDFPQSNYWTTLVANYEADENEYIVGNLTLTDIYGTQTFDSVGVRLKGNSSYSHPGNKKSFKIDFNKFVAGQNYDGLKKLNFSNGFKDPTCMREKVFSDICLAAGVLAPRTSFAEVNFNSTAWGFYTVVEQIDDQFMDWAILDDDGNLFKAGDNFGGGPGGSGGDAADLLYYGSEQSAYESRYELKSNEDLNDWTDLISFLDFINNSSNEEFETLLPNQLELTEYLRSAALDNLFSNLDSYTGSARNYYLYHNLSSNKWEWIKWDGNETFGSYSNGVNGMTTLALNYHDDDRPLLERIFENENLYNLYLQELCDIQEQYFNSTYMDARIDEVKNLIQSSVYADNNKMYSNADFDTNIEGDLGGGPGPGGGTTYGLKSFVASKGNYVQGQVDCSLFTGLEDLELVTVSLYPNPAFDRVQLDLSRQIGSVHVQFIASDGRIVLEEWMQGGRICELDISRLPSGLYGIQIRAKDYFGRSRLIIE